MKRISHYRDKYYPQSTMGKLYFNGNKIAYTLEDSVRPRDIKVKGHTAIPAGVYKVSTRYSPSFERDMLILYTEKDKESIDRQGVVFKYVYQHGGNKHEQTDGCILTAKNRKDNTIWGSLEKDIYDMVKRWLDDEEEVYWEIINEKQAN